MPAPTPTQPTTTTAAHSHTTRTTEGCFRTNAATSPTSPQPTISTRNSTLTGWEWEHKLQPEEQEGDAKSDVAGTLVEGLSATTGDATLEL